MILKVGNQYVAHRKHELFKTSNIQDATNWQIQHISTQKVNICHQEKCWDVFDTNFPQLTLFSKNQHENQKFKLIKQSSEGFLLAFKNLYVDKKLNFTTDKTKAGVFQEVHQPTSLVIISFNIASGVTMNHAGGFSEDPMTRKCQAKYKKTQGWSKKYGKKISQCTENVARFLVSQDADVVGIQEGDKKHMLPIFLQVMEEEVKMQKKNKLYEMSGNGTCYYIYNVLKVGHPDVFLSGHTDMRCAQGLYFSMLDLVFVNAWIDHKGNGAARLSKVPFLKEFYKITKRMTPPKRVIATMDSNDASGSMINKTLRICGHRLRLAGEAQPTCCTDVNYTYVGDYIFDSKRDSAIFYGVPSVSTFMSDHLPVMLKTLII